LLAPKPRIAVGSIGLIGGAQAEPLKANGEASGGDKRGRLRSRLSVLIDVKISVIQDHISGKYFHVFEY